MSIDLNRVLKKIRTSDDVAAKAMIESIIICTKIEEAKKCSHTKAKSH